MGGIRARCVNARDLAPIFHSCSSEVRTERCCSSLVSLCSCCIHSSPSPGRRAMPSFKVLPLLPTSSATQGETYGDKKPRASRRVCNSAAVVPERSMPWRGSEWWGQRGPSDASPCVVAGSRSCYCLSCGSRSPLWTTAGGQARAVQERGPFFMGLVTRRPLASPHPPP